MRESNTNPLRCFRFERHYALVKSCYADYASVLKASENQHQLQGLNLLCMLAQSTIAEFHTELELIPVSHPPPPTSILKKVLGFCWDSEKQLWNSDGVLKKLLGICWDSPSVSPTLPPELRRIHASCSHFLKFRLRF